MIIGAHFLLYSNNAEADRLFFRDVLGLRSVDVGHGWLIFGMNPAEAAIHPSDGDSQSRSNYKSLGAELYLMCDDLDAFVARVKKHGVECGEVKVAPWGRISTVILPSGGSIGVYQPTHPTALHLTVQAQDPS